MLVALTVRVKIRNFKEFGCSVGAWRRGSRAFLRPDRRRQRGRLLPRDEGTLLLLATQTVSYCDICICFIFSALKSFFLFKPRPA